MKSVQSSVAVETDTVGASLCDGIDLPTAEYVARTSLLELLHSNEEAMEFFQDTVLHGSDGNPGITAVFCLLSSHGRRYLVTEFVAGGSLMGSFSSEESRQAVPLLRFLQGATGRPPVWEGEPSSWEPDGDHIKLVDFGFAKFTGRFRDPLCGTIVVTPEFVAPRVLAGPGGADLAKVCSAGITLYEMLRYPERSVQGSERVLVLFRLSPRQPLRRS
jgi:serine/threonine protein kinase